jgi:hypothetical protein
MRMIGCPTRPVFATDHSVFHCEATLNRRSESCLCFNVVSGSHVDIIASESEYNPSGMSSMTEANI